MSQPRLLASILGTVDQAALREVVANHVAGLIDETLDEWDDAARWRTLITRYGSGPIHEAAGIAVRKTIDDLFTELRG